LGETEVQSATDFLLLCGVDNYPGCRGEFSLALPDGTSLRLSPAEPVQTDPVSGTISVSAYLATENTNLSPILDGDVQLAVGTVLPESVYVSRAIPVPGDTVTIYLECFEPGTQRVRVFLEIDGVWVEVAREIGSGKPTGDGFVEYTLLKSGLSIEETRVRIVLSAHGAERAMARNLRVVVS